MAIAAIAVGNLSTSALYVSSFHVEVFSDSTYTTLVGSKACPAIKGSTGNWLQSELISINGLVRGQTYYIQAGPVSPGGVANFTRYSVQAGVLTVPACTYGGTFAATSSGVSYDIVPASVPTDLDHFEAIWTKDGSAPSNSSLENAWQGQRLANGIIHLFVGGTPGQNIHLFFRAVSTSGGYQNWVAVDNRTVSTSSSGSISAAGIFYADGSTVESLKPAAAGADVTGANTAADTQAVNGINSGHISDTATSVGFVGKWWRTSSSAPSPSGGGELPYAPMFTTHDAYINYNIHGYSTWAGSIQTPSFAPYPPTFDGQWIYARFTGYYTSSVSGTYTFGVNSDDGANLYVNGVALVSDLASTHGAGTSMTYLHSGNINLVAGDVYEVIVEYRNGVNNCGIQVLMTPPGGAIQLLNLGTAFKNAAFMSYTDGTTVDALKPAAAGADVTAVNISADTSAVGGRPAADVATTILAGGGTDYLHAGNANTPQNLNNLVIRGSFEDLSVGTWGPGTHVSGGASPGYGFTQALVCTVRDTFESGNSFTVSPGQRVYCSAILDTENIPPGYGNCAFGLFFPSLNQYAVAGSLTQGLAWTAISGIVNVPTGAVTAVPWIQIDHVAPFNPAALLYVANIFYSKTPAVDFSEPTHINKNANNIPYADGTTIQALKPAQVGADMTAAQPLAYTGMSANLVPNGDFLLGNLDGWSIANAFYNSNGMNLPNGHGFSPTFAVQPGNKYRITYYMGKTAGSDGTYQRIFWGSKYLPNIYDTVSGYMGFQDFVANVGLVFPLTEYTYDWVAPAGSHYASLAIYNVNAGNTYTTRVVVQDYSASAQWGADVTGSNTANNTNNVASVSAATIASVVPSGFKLFINSGSRSYSIQAI